MRLQINKEKAKFMMWEDEICIDGRYLEVDGEESIQV